MTPLYQKIVQDGHYEVIKSYQEKDSLVKDVVREIYHAIKSVAGDGAANQVHFNGLDNMHEFISPDLIPALQSLLDEKLKHLMLKATKSFAQEKLGLTEEFYLDLKVISRIKFPFEVARKSKVSYFDYAAANGRTTFQKPPEVTAGYHRNLPFPAWNHGPHADSWFGHSYDGINLWWAIAGVTEESGMTFYPDFVGEELPVIDEPPYLEKDYPLPKPVLFNLSAGEVIAFNSDTLHGSRVNTSGKTRVSLSTRINPLAPRFNLQQFRHVQYWVKSVDLENMLRYAVPTGEQSHRFDSAFDQKSNPYITVVKKEDPGTCEGVKGNSCKMKGDFQLPVMRIDVWGDDGRVCLGKDLTGQLVVYVGKERIIVNRTPKGLRALLGICPHVGYELNGHDDEKLYCNGHGLAFDWDTGQSGCPLYKVKTYSVEENETGTWLSRKREGDIEAVPLVSTGV